MAKNSTESEEFVDHYEVLGLPTGDKGSKLSIKQITKAYHIKSKEIHPDKRPNDLDATAQFQRMKASYEVLSDASARAVFDALLRSRRERILREPIYDPKRRKFASDLERRERAAASASPDPVEIASRKEKMVAAELQRELAQFQARHAKKDVASSEAPSMSERKKAGDEPGINLDEEKMLRVSWEKTAKDYSAVKLRDLFERFGGVEDVVIRAKGSKKKASAIIVMSSKDAAVAAVQAMVGDISNPLLVLPLRGSSSNNRSSPFSTNHAEEVSPESNNIAGAGFHAFEASIMRKLEKAKERKSTQ